MAILLVLIRIFIGAVFIYAGWGRLMAPVENFMAVIEGYQFLKPPFVSWVAYVFPWLELIFGTFIALGFLTRTSAVSLIVFAISFIAILLRSFWLHLPISECGCFGSEITLLP